jgi:glycosyltransferase involved in cell wall biosynthesis
MKLRNSNKIGQIRIVQLVAGLDVGARDGGAEYFGVQLARFLNRQEFEPAVFIMWYNDSDVEKKWLNTLLGEGIQVAGLNKPGRSVFLDLFPIYKKLQVFVSEFKPDIIHTHSQRGDLIALAIKLLRPYVYVIRTVHIDQPWLNRLWADFVFNKLLFPLMFDAEVAVSGVIQSKLNKRLVARVFGKEAKLCYNGIDSALFDKRFLRCKLCLPPDIPEVHPCIGVVGRLVKQKGISYLLNAVYRVNQRRDVYLLVIGSGPLESDLRSQVQELGLTDKVYFLGKRLDVIQILPHLDAIVSSSLWEGLSTVLLEAMALRVPVIATDVSGSREIIHHKETGLLVPPKDPVSLAEAILAILDNPAEARKMADRAYNVARDYTIQNAAVCYAKLYHQVLKHSS